MYTDSHPRFNNITTIRWLTHSVAPTRAAVGGETGLHDEIPLGRALQEIPQHHQIPATGCHTARRTGRCLNKTCPKWLKKDCGHHMSIGTWENIKNMMPNNLKLEYHVFYYHLF